MTEPLTNTILASILHLDPSRPRWKPTKTGSSSLSSTTPHSSGGTKGDVIVPADRTIAATLLHAATATLWYTLHNKHINGSRALDQTTGRHHSIHDDRIKLMDTGHEATTRGLRCSCNKEWTRGGAHLNSRSATGQEPPPLVEICHHRCQTPKTLTLMGWASIRRSQGFPHLEIESSAG
jgi:hypothetical protein